MYINIKNLSKKYNQKSILKNFSLKVNKGEIISLVGSSGCGKTTLLKCISGLCEINEGEIIINSKPIHNIAANKRNIAYVFQESPLLPHLKVIDNILFNMNNFDNEKLNYLLSKMQIIHLKDRYPYEISGGENQRIAVARSIIRNPELLLLDEPFSNLDISTKKHTKELVFEIIKKTNTTTIVVNHDVQDSLEISDKILVLDKERINMFDTPMKVYTAPNSLATAKLFGDINFLKLEEETFYCRPQDIKIVNQSRTKAKVIFSKFLGYHYKIIAQVSDQNITIFNNNNFKKDTIIHLEINSTNKLNFKL